jgi:hypothetical protein
VLSVLFSKVLRISHSNSLAALQKSLGTKQFEAHWEAGPAKRKYSERRPDRGEESEPDSEEPSDGEAEGESDDIILVDASSKHKVADSDPITIIEQELESKVRAGVPLSSAILGGFLARYSAYTGSEKLLATKRLNGLKFWRQEAIGSRFCVSCSLLVLMFLFGVRST